MFHPSPFGAAMPPSPFGAPAPFGAPLGAGPMMGPYGPRAPSMVFPVEPRDETVPEREGDKSYHTERDEEPTQYWETYVKSNFNPHYSIRGDAAPAPVRPKTSLRMVGTAQEGETLSVDGWWTDLDKRGCRYQWSCRFPGEHTFKDIRGATYDSYRLNASEVNSTVRCVVTHDGETDEVSAHNVRAREVYQAPVAAAAPAPVAAPVGASRMTGVQVTGGPHHTTPLVCRVSHSPASAAPPRVRYQWLRAESSIDMEYIPLSGATSDTYHATADDLHSQLRVEVTELNNDNSTAHVELVDVDPSLLNIDPQVAQRVSANVNKGSATFGVTMVSTDERVSIVLSNKHVKVNDAMNKKLIQADYLDNTNVVLAGDDNLFSLDTDGLATQFVCADHIERDVIALTIRSFVGNAILAKDRTGLHRVQSLDEFHPRR